MSFRYSAHLLACVLVFSLNALDVHAQAAKGKDAAPQQNAETTVIKASAQLVVVDVVVQDSNGNAVQGLTADNFRISENKNEQPLRQFEEHSTLRKIETPGKLDLPLGTFTDYTPVRSDAPLNILLLDMINTPTQDQLFVRNQLKEYAKHADPNARIAIMGMAAGKLIMLQSFTTDPRILQAAVDNKLNTRSSPFLDDSSTQGTRAQLENNLASAGVNVAQGVDTRLITEHLQDIGESAVIRDMLMQLQSSAETQSFQTSLRMQETLETFDQLALYLASLPGRKNLIWFSGSFPLSVMPDASIPNPFSVIAGAEKEYREMTNLMTRAQVAVYPIEAGGLGGPSDVDPSQLTMGQIPRHGDPQPVAPSLAGNAAFTPLSNSFATQVDNHVTMEKLADDTGGHAAYNSNGLSTAVKNAIDAGANYYTLAYSPSDRNWDSRYRSIHVDMTGPLAGRHLKLSYRRGYYADDPLVKPSKNVAAVTRVKTQSNTSGAHLRGALTFGAPPPSDIIFKARVLPATVSSEPGVAPKNRLTPLGTKGPYRRYLVDYAAIPRTLSWTTDASGQMECNAELGALVYDHEGRLLNSMSQSFHYKLSPADYKLLSQEGMQLHMEVSVPAIRGSYLRLAIHDFNSDKFGVVEVPVSAVDKLSPAI